MSTIHIKMKIYLFQTIVQPEALMASSSNLEDWQLRPYTTGTLNKTGNLKLSM